MEEKERIVLVKLFNGEMVLGGKLPSEGMFNVKLSNPRVVAMVPTMTGSVKVALGTVCEPFASHRLEKSIEFPTAQIMFTLEEDEIDPELINGYKSEISGIRIASASETASINSGQDGSFAL